MYGGEQFVEKPLLDLIKEIELKNITQSLYKQKLMDILAKYK